MASGVAQKYADGTDSGWQPLTSDNMIGTIYYRKIGNQVTVRSYGNFASSTIGAGKALQLATIPSGYRPVDAVGMSAITNSGSTYDRVFPVMVMSTGAIWIYANGDGPIAGGSSGLRINFIATYLTD